MENQTKKCIFSMAWIGICDKPGYFNKNFCEKHSKVKCSCGAQAIYECSATIGPMVCGRPHCNKCKCNH